MASFVTKSFVVENLEHQSFMSQRVIVDHMCSVGGALNVDITKELFQFASGLRQRYMAYLEGERKKRVVSEKRKAEMDLLTVTELKQKKLRLEIDIDSLTKSADEYAEKAE